MVLGSTSARHDIAKNTSVVLEAADRAEPKIRRALLRAFAEIQQTVPDIETLISAGKVGPVVEALSTVNAPKFVVDALADATLSAAVQAGAPAAARFGIAMNDVNPRAVTFAATHTLNLVKIPPFQAQWIQEVITDSIEQGLNPRVTARLLREQVPLTTRHREAVDRFRRSFPEGTDPDYIARQVSRKTRRLTRWRAETIARTESIRAANEGQQLAWETAMDQGLLDETRTRKVWVSTSDSRRCAQCESLHGTPVKLGSEFTVPPRSSKGTATTTKTPPAHPNCRCALVLEFV